MKDDKQGKVKYPGTREAMDGNTAVIMCEREASDAAGAYPITPSTQMGEYWAEAAAAGHLNTSGRPLIFIEPEGEHAAAAVTAGLSMTGLRSTNFSSGQGIAYMHESLYAAVGKRLTYVLNIGCRAITKSSLNVHAGHDDYHCVDDTGCFQLFGKNVQEVSDLNIIAHKIAELSLTPGVCAQDGFLTTHLIESVMLAERALIDEYLGKPSDIIDTPTPAQRLMYGDKRRRIPELWTVDNPVMAGTVQNQDAYMQSVASQRPYFFDHIAEIADQCMAEFTELTGRDYKRVLTYRCEDADYLIVGQGSLIPSCEVVADYLRETRDIKVGVVNMVMFRPFPGDLIGPLLKGRKGVTVLERTDQPLAEDLPLVREIRAAMAKCIENGQAGGKNLPYPDYETYKELSEVPPLYSGCYGMGSRDLQPEGVIGTVENMLPEGPHKKNFYLSIDFVHDKPFTPKQEIYQEQILEGYPNVKDLAVRGSENPNLMPKEAITVRFHSVGGWGAMTTGKNLAMTLFDLLGYHIKANPKYGSEKKGQPTTFYLSAAPEPIRVNCEYFYVDVVLSPDPNVLSHTNALSGLKKGGVFIIQSELDSPEEVWQQQFPPRYQKMIVDNDIRVFYLDGFKIAREIASTPELEFRMQGIAFMGAFFAASPTMEQADLTEDRLFKAIEDQLEKKFGAKGRRVVEGNLTTVKRGFTEAQEVKDKKVREQKTEDLRKEATMPVALKRLPSSEDRISDIHRFWEQTGNFYLTGRGNDNLTDPFIAMSCLPVASGVFRDMTQIRFEHPNWSAEKCTGCGNCWSICPDGAIPGLVNTIPDVLSTAVARIEGTGKAIKYLRKFTTQIERQARRLMNAGTNSDNANAFLAQATEAVKAEVTVSFPDDEKAALGEEFDLLKDLLGEYKFAITRPFFGLPEKDQSGNGGLLSITIDPYTCKGCMECVQVCPEDALSVETQTPETIAHLRKNWDFWLALPNTKPDYIKIDDLDEGIGQLETLLLDKNCAKSMVCGDGACLGCGEKTAVRLFVAANTALMAPRVKKQLERIDDLIVRLEKHLRLKLAETVDVSDTESMFTAIEAMKEQDLTLKNLTSELEKTNITVPIDSEWLGFVTSMLAKLKQLKWHYEEGVTGQGRTTMGIINATGCTSVWGSTFPYNPYPFPWANHLFQDCASVAMGLFEGHMAKMAEGFKAVRMAELELEGAYKAAEHDEYFTYFDWDDFSDDEWLLCPPVVSMGGDGALYDIGFQNVSRMLMSGKPIKLFCVDTQVYSNTGGQACTSGFFGQVSDMAQYGKAIKGKEEIRKEFGLIAAMHRTSFVVQGTIANTGHLLENMIKGLNSRRPGVFVVNCPCMPEHGIGDDAAKYQAKLALESRAFPLFTWDPDEGLTSEECLNLDGNPAMDEPWPTYTLSFVDENGKPAKMELPMTFADYAATEYRFRKHFKAAKRDAWDDSMVPVAEYLEMDAEDREDAQPYVLAVDRQNRLSRLIVAEPIIRSCEERQEFWTLLKGMAGLDREEPDMGAITAQAKTEAIQQLTAGLMQLAGGSGAAPAAPAVPAPAPAAPAEATQGETMSNADYAPVEVDSQDCTGCGECMLVNPKMFGWNDKKQAVVLDPKAGPYKDCVKAAEKCPARVIRPGTPADPNEKGVEKLLKRAEKFNA